MNTAAKRAVRTVALALIVSTPWAVPGGEFAYNAEGKVAQPGGRRALDWETAGQVSAPDRGAAEANVAPVIDQFLRETYPGWVEVPGSRRLSVRSVNDLAGGPNHATVRVAVQCLGYVVQKAPDLTIMAWDVVTHDVVTDLFTVRLLTAHDGADQQYETRVRTLGRGAWGEQYRSFKLWEGELVDGDPPTEFGVRLFVKNLPDLARYSQPPEPNPDDPNDGFTEVGSFRVQLRHAGGRLVADWQPLAHAGTPYPARPGPGLLSQRFVLKRAEAVPFAVSVFASKEADRLAALAAAREEERARQDEMKRKLAAAGPGIRVFTGSAEGKAPDALGRPGTVGVGALVLLSLDREAAVAYLAREFSGDPNAIIAATEDEAGAALRARFARQFPNGRLAGEPKLTPKTGRTVMDRIRELPPRPPRRRR